MISILERAGQEPSVSNPNIRPWAPAKYDGGMAKAPPKALDDDDPYVPQRLFFKEWMVKRELTAKIVAERMECGEGTLSKLINGKQRRTDHWIARFAKAVGINPWDLWKHPDIAAQEEAAKDKERQELIREIRAIIDPLT
jgi:plasmid maintenance system antidote protein VapI